MRGYRQIDIKGEGGEKPSPQTLKLFWDGLVNDINWTFTWKKSDSDSRESHSITNTFVRQQTGVGGTNTYTLDISSLRGFYFVSIYTSSQNRNGSGISVSRVWLEQ